ncbi:MAG: sugar ABC transporter permease [Treponema sp.]|jgi:multiple sugar transport system permease protein|nr:sugar ABC transporter permease [Treponema sp.]
MNRRADRRAGRFPAGLGFALPGLAGFAVFFIIPFGVSLAYAFMDRPAGGSFAGFSNFAALFRSRAYLRGLGNTIRFIGISTPLGLALSLGLALLVRRAGKQRDWFSLVFLIPLVIPSGSMAFFWKTLFSYDGALNGTLRRLGLEKLNWLDSDLALPVMILIYLWKNCGYGMVLFLAGLGNIPGDYYEAARADGAAPFRCFIHVTLPCLLPVTALALTMSVVNSFKIFREIYLVAGAYPHESIYTLQHFMNNMFASLNYPRLSSAAAVLVLLSAALTQALLYAERRASA